MTRCSHLEQVNLGTEGETKGCEECEKIGSTGCIYDYAYPVVMWDAVILPPTNMERNISKQLVIP